MASTGRAKRHAPFIKALGAMHKLIIFVVLFIFSFNSFSSEVLWRTDKNALAFCDKTNESTCFVVVNNNSTDVSLIEGKNIGKLGVTPKDQYDKVVTLPSSWKRTDSDGDLVIFTTKAWLKGQRYTIQGMVFVDSNGKYVHQ